MEHGYGNLSLETIAKEARVSMRTIYSHFGGKAGLFGAVICRCSDHFDDILPEHGDPKTALIAFAQEFIYQLTRPEVVRLRAILIGEAMRFPELAAQFYAQGPQLAQEKLAVFFTQQQQAGNFLCHAPTLLADHFMSCLRNGHFYRLQLGLEPTPELDSIKLSAQQTVEIFLFGTLIAK